MYKEIYKEVEKKYNDNLRKTLKESNKTFIKVGFLILTLIIFIGLISEGINSFKDLLFLFILILLFIMFFGFVYIISEEDDILASEKFFYKFLRKKKIFLERFEHRKENLGTKELSIIIKIYKKNIGENTLYIFDDPTKDYLLGKLFLKTKTIFELFEIKENKIFSLKSIFGLSFNIFLVIVVLYIFLNYFRLGIKKEVFLNAIYGFIFSDSYKFSPFLDSVILFFKNNFIEFFLILSTSIILAIFFSIKKKNENNIFYNNGYSRKFDYGNSVYEKQNISYDYRKLLENAMIKDKKIASFIVEKNYFIIKIKREFCAINFFLNPKKLLKKSLIKEYSLILLVVNYLEDLSEKFKKNYKIESNLNEKKITLIAKNQNKLF